MCSIKSTKCPFHLLNYHEFSPFSRRNGLLLRLKSLFLLWSIIMKHYYEALPEFSGRAVVEGSPFLIFNNAQSFWDYWFNSFHTEVRWVTYTGSWSFSGCEKQPFTSFLCLLLAMLWQSRSLMLILLIRSIIQDVLTYWTGSSAPDTGKN